MRNLKNKNPNKNIKFNTNKKRQEQRDDLDSRSGTEQEFKGEHVTHNKKDHHNAPRKGKY